MTSFPGWTWEYIDERMTIRRLLAINAYQAKHMTVQTGVENLVFGFLERKQ